MPIKYKPNIKCNTYFHSTGIIGLLKLNYNRHDYLINHVTILIFDSRFCKVTFIFAIYRYMVISYRLSIWMSSINWSIDHFVGLNWSRIVFKICSYLEIHFLRANGGIPLMRFKKRFWKVLILLLKPKTL